MEKKCPKPSWQALTPLDKRGKKVPQIILASLYTPRQRWGPKSAPNDPGKPLHSQANVGNKSAQTILASLYTSLPLTGNAHKETTHFKKGLPLAGLWDCTEDELAVQGMKVFTAGGEGG